MLVSVFIHVESSGNDLYGTSYVMMSIVLDMNTKRGLMASPRGTNFK